MQYKNSTRRNLISKRTGIGDHMISDEVTRKYFPNASAYMDIINCEDERLGYSIKNQFVSIDWIKELIGNKEWEKVGKEKSLYEYFIDCDDIRKPNEKNGYNEEQLYKIASGDMQFDFDDINENQIADLFNAFNICKEKNPSYHWFETSWSGHGCHIRVFVKLIMKTKLEWGFWYIHLLNGILKYVEDKTLFEHIDWSCASITRGFAIPYNEGGPKISKYYNEEKIIGIRNDDELDKVFKHVSYQWQDELYDYFVKKFLTPKKKKELQNMGLVSNPEGYRYVYTMEGDWDFDENHPMVDGEYYNYNWRLSLVTTLMAVFNKDTEIVRNICSVIYKYITEYKNHTYEEMIGNEFENKILRRANFDLEPSRTILAELWKDWGLKIKISPRIV